MVAVPPLVVDAQARPDWRVLDAVRRRHRRRARDAADGRPVVASRRRCRSARRARGSPRRSSGRSGLRAEEDFFCVFSPERVFSGRVFADLATYPKLVGGLSAEGEARGVELYERVPATPRSGGWARPRRPSWPSSPRRPTATSTSRSPTSSRASPTRAGVDVERVIDAANSQPFSHIHRPGVAVGGHCIPVYPRFYLRGRPRTRGCPRSRARSTRRCPPTPSSCWPPRSGERLAGERVLVLGVAYRGGVKETAFCGAFALRDELAAPRRAAGGRRPALRRRRAARRWASSRGTARRSTGAILQADHAEYRDLGPADLPGARAVVDGRGVLDPARFAAPAPCGGSAAAQAPAP